MVKMSPEELISFSEEFLKQTEKGLNWKRRVPSEKHAAHQFVIKPQLERAVDDFRNCGYILNHLPKILAGLLISKNYTKNVLALAGKLPYSFQKDYLYYLPFDDLERSDLTSSIGKTGRELVINSIELNDEDFATYVDELSLVDLIAMFKEMYAVYEKPTRYYTVFCKIYEVANVKQNDFTLLDDELLSQLSDEVKDFLFSKGAELEEERQASPKRGRKSKKQTFTLSLDLEQLLQKDSEQKTSKNTEPVNTQLKIKYPEFTIGWLEACINETDTVGATATDEKFDMEEFFIDELDEGQVKALISVLSDWGCCVDIKWAEQQVKILLKNNYFKEAVDFIGVCFWKLPELNQEWKKRHAFIKNMVDALNKEIKEKIIAYKSISSFREDLTKTNNEFLVKYLFVVSGG